jgi:hypothetical protein
MYETYVKSKEMILACISAEVRFLVFSVSEKELTAYECEYFTERPGVLS